MKLKNLLVILLIFSTLTSCGQTSKNEIDMETVKNLELDKYLGTWYEIARFDHSFERDLVGVTATYSMRKDGKIKVVNQGYKHSLDGKLSQAVGKAKIPNPNEPGKLKVSFFWIFYADYFVLELADDYSYALVGSSSPKYLWILSRTPQMPDETYNLLIDKAKQRGYNLEKLIKVEQKQIVRH